MTGPVRRSSAPASATNDVTSTPIVRGRLVVDLSAQDAPSPTIRSPTASTRRPIAAASAGGPQLLSCSTMSHPA